MAFAGRKKTRGAKMRYKIGFIDSGVGGISVMTRAKKEFENADFIYYADTKNVPYGTKTHEEIKRLSDSAVDFVTSKGADVIVIACNTITSVAIEYLREKYLIPIIGMEPAVKPAVTEHPSERILVCATPVTIAGEKLHNLIDKNCRGTQPILVPTPRLVEFAENGVFDTGTVCGYLSSVVDMSVNYSAVVLGCTHFGYFTDSFKKLFPRADIADGSLGTVKRLHSVLDDRGYNVSQYDGEGTTEYYSSGECVTDEKTLDFYKTLADRTLGFIK